MEPGTFNTVANRFQHGRGQGDSLLPPHTRTSTRQGQPESYISARRDMMDAAPAPPWRGTR